MTQNNCAFKGSFHLMENGVMENTWFLHAIYLNVRQHMGLGQLLGVST